VVPRAPLDLGADSREGFARVVQAMIEREKALERRVTR
jgi:hypothetical protein